MDTACFSWWNLSVCSVYLVCAALRGCGDDRGAGGLKLKKKCVCQGWAAVGEPAIWQLRGDDRAAALVRPSLPIGIYLRAVKGIRSSNLGAFANKHVSILSLFMEANKPVKPLAKAFPSWASGSVALYWWRKKICKHTGNHVFYISGTSKKKKKKHVFGTQYMKMCVLNRENHIFLKQRRERRNC